MSDEKTTEAGPEGGPSADRLLLGVARRGGPWLGGLAVSAIALTAIELALPWVMGRAIDTMTGDAPRSWLVWFGVLVALVVAFDTLMDIGLGASTARATAWLRRSALQHLLAVGPGAARTFTDGDLASRLVGNSALAGVVASDLVRAAANLLPAVGGVVALGLIDPWLLITFAAGLPLFLALLRAFAREASEIASRYLEVQARIAGRLVDALSGHRTIVAAGTAAHEVKRVLAPLPDLHRYGMDMWRAQMRMEAQDALLVPLIEVAVLAVAGIQLARGAITPGELVAASQYAALGTGLGAAVNVVARVARARAGAGRVAEVLARPAVRYGHEQLPPGRGRVEFRAVTVAVDGRVVLDGLDLVIPPGALIAVVGRSGAGKSLLAALLGRLVDPDTGEVLVDGVAVQRLERAELRRQVVYGFERPVLMGDTVGDAIAFGASTPTPQAVTAAARAALADGFIRRLPAGYETSLVDVPMSGGEVQRVGLARVFAHLGRVVVLDDVGASLDTITEHHINRILTAELAGRTRIVVAHRASTAAGADLVAWLDAGRVRAVGQHRQLWQDLDYRALFEAPASSYAAPRRRVAGGVA